MSKNITEQSVFGAYSQKENQVTSAQIESYIGMTYLDDDETLEEQIRLTFEMAKCDIIGWALIWNQECKRTMPSTRR